jgi:hypothetical protein
MPSFMPYIFTSFVGPRLIMDSCNIGQHSGDSWASISSERRAASAM